MDHGTKRALMRRIPHGIYVCGCVNAAGDDVNAFTLTWMMQASLKPPLVMIASRKGTISNSFIRESKVFSVNFLGTSQKDLAESFFRPRKRVGNKFDDVPFHTNVTGAPILDDAQGAFECRLIGMIEHGDHDVIVGEVISAEAKEPMEPQLLLSDTGWQYGG